jgi:hypothetical protein
MVAEDGISRIALHNGLDKEATIWACVLGLQASTMTPRLTTSNMPRHDLKFCATSALHRSGGE